MKATTPSRLGDSSLSEAKPGMISSIVSLLPQFEHELDIDDSNRHLFLQELQIVPEQLSKQRAREGAARTWNEIARIFRQREGVPMCGQTVINEFKKGKEKIERTLKRLDAGEIKIEELLDGEVVIREIRVLEGNLRKEEAA